MNVDYKADLAIDANRLEKEFIEQPSLFMKYNQLCTECRRDLDKARQDLITVKAGIDKAIRTDPVTYTGKEKITEAQITALIEIELPYIEAQDKIVELNYEYNLLLGAVRAFDQRKSSLENLVKLLGMDYFSTPVEISDDVWDVTKLSIVDKNKKQERIQRSRGRRRD